MIPGIEKGLVLTLVTALSLLVQASERPQVDTIQIATKSKPPRIYTIEKPVEFESTIHIGTEEDSDQYDVKIALSNKKLKLKLEQRYETSLSVQDEGPHLDLVQWKHFVSDWVEVLPRKAGIYRSLLISQEEANRFPSIELSSVLDEIKRQDPNWLNVVKNAKSIRDYPFSIGVSTVSFRISVFTGNKWIPVHVVHCLHPMGC